MKKARYHISLIFRSLKEIHKLRSWYLWWLICQGAFRSAAPFVNIYMSARIIDKIAAGKALPELLLTAIMTAALNFLVLVGERLMIYAVNTCAYEFNENYKMNFGNKVMAMDYTAVENPLTRQHRTKINEYVNLNGGGLWMLLAIFPVMIQALCTIIYSAALSFSLFTAKAKDGLTGAAAFVASPAFSLILALCILGNALFSMYAKQNSTRKIYAHMDSVVPFLNPYIYYVDNYITRYQTGKDIRIYAQQALVKNELMLQVNSFNRTVGLMAKDQAKYDCLTAISGISVNTLSYLFVGLRSFLGMFGIGYIVQYIGSIREFTAGFTELMTQIARMTANNEAIQAYFDFMDIPSEMYQGALPVEKRYLCESRDKDYEIEFIDVSFHYPGSENLVLKNVSLKFRAGERLAVVGMNGSGKTTFIKLLCRLYDPTEGEILLNGVNIKKYKYDEYLSIFSVVFQDFKLFSFSLAQNVAANTSYDRERVKKCLESAGLGSRLGEMPKGIETCLYKNFEEDGVEISGGEAQKIALARALYRDAPFIILDEPTAALDPLAEYEIYSRFNELVEDKTAIYISHRLSSCRFCDDIAVFDAGKLVQQGSHDALVADRSGKYYQLWNAQAQYYQTQ